MCIVQNGVSLLATQGETHNANLFAYCNNNPVNRVDYTGRKSNLSSEDLLYIFMAWASLQVLENFGVTECFDEELYHYVYAIDKYGLVHAQFAFKGNRKYSERYVIYKVVWGCTVSWYTMATSDKYKRLTQQASKTLWNALENTSEHIESMPTYNEDNDARMHQLMVWRNTGLGIILHSGELLNAYHSLEYQYPYLNLLNSYKNSSGIAILLEPFFTSFPNVRLSMQANKTYLPEYTSIEKSMGI